MPLLRVFRLLPVLAEQALQQFIRQRAVKKRFEDGIVQCLHRMPVILARKRVAVVEAA